MRPPPRASDSGRRARGLSARSPTVFVLLHDAPAFFERARHGLHWLGRHTGIPIILLAAAILVLSYRVFKKTARLAIEIAVVAVLLLVATHLGWLRF